MFPVRIITPERVLPEYQADHVTLPAFDGEVGVRTGHAAMVCLLGPGLLRLKSSTHADEVFALKGGVAQVSKKGLDVLAESAVEQAKISEKDLVVRLQKIIGGTYDDPVALAEARTEAFWLATQLRVAGKTVPDLSKLGL